jgi:hypothetical protein
MTLDMFGHFPGSTENTRRREPTARSTAKPLNARLLRGNIGEMANYAGFAQIHS